nr:hypothetical protein CFP56_09736 [Quercus suber]
MGWLGWSGWKSVWLGWSGWRSVVRVEIGNPWVLDYGFGWRWRWLGLVGEAGFFWVSVRVGCGRGDRCGRGEGNGDDN